jgi:glycosyltransferase involved in cell wall biosynthesis
LWLPWSACSEGMSRRKPGQAPPLASFVIPTLFRTTLQRTLDSLRQQTVRSWEALLVPDPRIELRDMGRLIPDDSRIKLLHAPQDASGSAGLLRNVALKQVCGHWVCFVDDDDHLGERYIEHLAEHAHDPRVDVVVFRMKDPNLGILPNPQAPRLEVGHVGVSYAVRRRWLKDKGFRFVRESVAQRFHEDWVLLSALKKADAKILISPHVDYYVKDARATV